MGFKAPPTTALQQALSAAVRLVALAEAGPSQFSGDANTANAQRKVVNNKFTRPTPQTRRYRLKLRASTYGARTRWSSRKIASSRAMIKPLARKPLHRGRNASHVSQC